MLSRVAYEDAVSRHRNKIYAYVLNRVNGHVEVAEDLLMQTFARAWERRHTFRPRENGVVRWLFGIAQFELLMHRRGYARTQAKLKRFKAYIDVVPASVESTSDVRNMGVIKAGMAKLRPIDRRLIELCYGQAPELKGTPKGKLDHYAIAEILSEETNRPWRHRQISVQRNRAINRLRDALRPEMAMLH